MAKSFFDRKIIATLNWQERGQFAVGYMTDAEPSHTDSLGLCWKTHIFCGIFFVFGPKKRNWFAERISKSFFLHIAYSLHSNDLK
jgi:hypothetical protein